MSSLDELISNLGRFWKRKNAFQELVKKGKKDPEEVVPKLLRRLESNGGKVEKRIKKVYEEIAKDIDLVPILYSVPTVENLWTFTESDNSISCVCAGELDDDNIMAVGSRSGTVYILDKEGEEKWKKEDITSGISSLLVDELGDKKVVIAGSGKAFGSSEENNVYVWSEKGGSIWTGIQPESWITDLKTGRLKGRNVVVAGCGGLEVRSTNLIVWDEEGNLLWARDEPNSWISGVRITELNGKKAVIGSSGDNNIYGWDATGSLVWEGTESEESLVGLTVGDLGGKEGIISISSNVYAWDKKKNLLWKSTHPDSWLRCVDLGDFNGKKMIVAGSEEGIVYGWDGKGDLVFKDESLNGEINTIKIGEIDGKNVIVAGTKVGSLYIWKEESSFPSVSNVPRDAINEIAFGNFEDQNVMISGSEDKKVYVFRYELTTLDDLISNTEEVIPVPDLKRKYKKLKKSVDTDTPGKDKEIYNRFLKLGEKIKNRQDKGDEIISDMKTIQEHIEKFRDKGIDTSGLTDRFERSKIYLKDGKIRNCENYLDDLLKDLSDIQKRLDKKKEKNKKIRNWIEKLEVDIDTESIPKEAIENLEPIYSKYEEILKELIIEENIDELREKIQKFDKVTDKYHEVSAQHRNAFKVSKNLNEFVTERLKNLKSDRQKLKRLKRKKELALKNIQDSTSSVILQSRSQKTWISPDDLLNRIREIEDKLKNTLEDLMLDIVKNTVDIKMKIGYENQEFFIPKGYPSKEKVNFGLRKIREEIKEIDDESLEKSIDFNKLNQKIGNSDLKTSSKLMNDIAHEIFRYKAILSLEETLKSEGNSKSLYENFEIPEDFKTNILARIKRKKKEVKAKMIEIQK